MVFRQSGRVLSHIFTVDRDECRLFAGVFLGKVRFLIPCMLPACSYQSLILVQNSSIVTLTFPPSYHPVATIHNHHFLPPHRHPVFCDTTHLPNSFSGMPNGSPGFDVRFQAGLCLIVRILVRLYDDIQKSFRVQSHGGAAERRVVSCLSALLALATGVRCILPLHRIVR
jgi:hypothetical protein